MNRPALRDIAAVLGLAAALRLLALLTLPLMITNDGAFYLLWGSEIAAGSWPDLPAYRTPGYPLFLALIIALAGHSVHAVLVAQHLLGVVTAACCWKVGRDIAGPRAAFAAGVFVALDPWLLAICSYALSEALSIALPIAALACVSGRTGLRRGVVAGALVGLAVLTRPATIAWLPGIAAVPLFAQGVSVRSRIARPAVITLTVLVTLAPWAAFNASRGIYGVARTEGLGMWGGLARSGLLDPAFGLPPSLETLAEPILRPTPPERDVMRFYVQAARTEGVDRDDLLSGWSRTSIAADPAGYATATVHAAAWQSNAMLPGSPYRYDSLKWMLQRLGGRGASSHGQANALTSHNPDIVARFADGAPTGPLAWILHRWPIGMPQCFPHLPAGLLTIVAIAIAAWKRRFRVATVLAASFPIVLGHAMILQPFARYGISAWMIWYVGAATLAALVLERFSRPHTITSPPAEESPSPR